MLKLGRRTSVGCVSVTAEVGEAVDVSTGESELSSLVAISRINVRRGRSLEDWNGKRHARQQNVRFMKVYSIDTRACKWTGRGD